MQTELEKVLMTCYKDQMISFVKSNPEVLEELIELALKDKQPQSWRAAWLLWSCLEKNDPRIKKYINRIIKVIESKQDGHQRELLKILLSMNLNDKQEGTVFNISMNLWEAVHKKPSVRYMAFRFIVKCMEKHPELKSEVEFLTQDHYIETLSPGAKHSIKKIIRNLK